MDIDEVGTLKAQANEAFKNSQFDQAILLYTLAIEACSPPQAAEHLHILYSNRSASNHGLGKKEGI
jgi:hypothetical protein